MNAGADRALEAALRAGAAGAWPEEAAIGLLIGAAPAVWRHQGWQQSAVQLDQIEQDGAALVLAEVDWPTAVAAARELDVPRSQVAIVRIAAALATGPLGAALGDLAPEDLTPVLAAVAHAVQGPPTY